MKAFGVRTRAVGAISCKRMIFCAPMAAIINACFWAMPACPPMRFRTAAVPLSIGTKNQAKFGFSVPGHNGQQVSG